MGQADGPVARHLLRKTGSPNSVAEVFLAARRIVWPVIYESAESEEGEGTEGRPVGAGRTSRATLVRYSDSCIILSRYSN